MKCSKFIACAALTTVMLTCCSRPFYGSAGGTSDAQAAVSPALPPQGVYNSCEIDTALTTMCEQEDAAMASDGYTWEINYIGLMANKEGPGSLKAWFTYDASIGMGQAFSIKSVINDPSSNVLAGTSLTNFNGDRNLATTCGAKNNEQIISCIASVARSVPGFRLKWYLYDEPGCPNQTIGYCQGTLAGDKYNNVATVANYIASIDPKNQILGVEVGETGNAPEMYKWLLSTPMPVSHSMTGFDHYPIPESPARPGFGTMGSIGTTASELAGVVKSNGTPAQQMFVGQAFSWYQEKGRGCTSVTVCPYPTTAQLRAMRDQALYYGARAGVPVSMIFWYYWPDIICKNTYPGCNAAANRVSLKTAAFAPFPATPP